MTASRNRLLRWLLVACGVMTLLALPAVFLPQAAMDAIHRSLGLGPLPEGPIVLYLARSLSAFTIAVPPDDNRLSNSLALAVK